MKLRLEFESKINKLSNYNRKLLSDNKLHLDQHAQDTLTIQSLQSHLSKVQEDCHSAKLQLIACQSKNVELDKDV